MTLFLYARIEAVCFDRIEHLHLGRSAVTCSYLRYLLNELHGPPAI